MTVTWDDGFVTAAVREAAFRAVVTGVEAVIAEGTRLIASPPKTGRIYHIRGVVHQASAPGEAPANLTSALKASARAIYPAQADLFRVVGYANWSTSYARRLELGDERMDARPYARPALDLGSTTFHAAVVGELRTSLSR